MTTMMVAGGRGRGRTAAGATIRAQLAAGLPHLGGVGVGVAGHVDKVQVLDGGAGLPQRPAAMLFSVQATTSAAAPQVWVALVWGTLPDGLTTVAGVSGDSKGGVVAHGETVASDLGLTDVGIVSDGGYGDPGQPLSVLLVASVYDDSPALPTC